MQIYLETERIILRRFTEDDAENLFALDSDPEVMRYLTHGAPTPYKHIQEQTLPRFLAWYAKSENYGFWAAIEKSSGEFIGWFHFRPDTRNPEEIEIGYRLRQKAWGKGYATEVSRALLRKGFEELEIPRISARTMAANQRSRHVMEKIGLTLAEEYSYPEFPGEDKAAVKYGLRREDYLQQRTVLATK